MRPFLRWAGGKRWLAEQNAMDVSTKMRLIEPFLGGGALFFSRDWKSAALSDTNRYLINAYGWMKEEPIRLYNMVAEHFGDHSSAHYYGVRERMGFESIQHAADFIYLNRSCFNGLFRVNLKGKFNVPIGTKAYPLDHVSEFLLWSRHLQKAQIRLADFEEMIDGAGTGDVIFADPPYTVNHNSNGFIEYNEKIFNWDDQVRLRDALMRATERGAQYIVTNADHFTIHKLYEGSEVRSIERGSEMAGRVSARGKTTEVIITSRTGA